MKTKPSPTHLSFATALGLLLPLTASAAVQVIGVNTTADGGYAANASATDLVNAGSSTLSSAPTYSAVPHFGPTTNNDGTVGTANTTADITFWLGAPAGATYSITYALNTTTNTSGYDIKSIQTIHGWTNNSGNQKNQNYIVEVSKVDNATFNTIATVAYLPFGAGATTGSTKVNITEDTSGILASRVDMIRFTYTIPASGGSNPSPTIREIDVFGVPTVSGPDLTPPTLASITDDRMGGPVTPNSPVIYTVTFNENMDETTVDSSDFDFAGTATATLGNISETSPGVFTVEATPTSTGTLVLRISAGATLNDDAGNALDTSADLLDDTTVTVENTPPTLVSSDIVDSLNGETALQNKPLSFTLTFSEAMDNTSLDNSDFANFGTATINLGAITEISPRVFSIIVTPTTSGTLQLQISAGTTLNDLAGNPLDTTLAILDDTTLTVDPNSVVVTAESSQGTPFADTPWAGNLSNSDLINAGQPTLAQVAVTTASFGGPHGGNDGISTGSSDSIFFSAGGNSNFPATATYDLDLTTNTGGYDITSIESFMGWSSNSGTHANQTYLVEVRHVDSPDYTFLTLVDYQPFGTANSLDHESHVLIDDSSGVLASGVDSIRFTFTAPEIGGNSPGTVIREIDVLGTPSGATPITITQISQSPGTVTLTWTKTRASTYIVRLSRDLIDWTRDLNDSVLPSQDEDTADADQITVTFPLGEDLISARKLFFRVEEG